MTGLHRTPLTTARKAEFAASALARQDEHGAKSELSRDYGVSRPSVYAAAATACFGTSELPAPRAKAPASRKLFAVSKSTPPVGINLTCGSGGEWWFEMTSWVSASWNMWSGWKHWVGEDWFGRLKGMEI